MTQAATPADFQPRDKRRKALLATASFGQYIPRDAASSLELPFHV